MTERIIIAGAGGQGIMLLGKILVEAANRENKFVTWFPSYGAEVRGGTAHCMVVISDAEIASPYVNKADSLIIMNEPSLERFKYRLRDSGLLIINSSLVSVKLDKYPGALKFPFTHIAINLGDIRVANMVALGCFLAHRKAADIKKVFKVIEEIAPADKRALIGINKKALREGARLK